jgi:hypothetical protein
MRFYFRAKQIMALSLMLVVALSASADREENTLKYSCGPSTESVANITEQIYNKLEASRKVKWKTDIKVKIAEHIKNFCAEKTHTQFKFQGPAIQPAKFLFIRLDKNREITATINLSRISIDNNVPITYSISYKVD